ncbi:hypothetical protein EIN_468530, partial [Entamoeba invadens IP1]
QILHSIETVIERKEIDTMKCVDAKKRILKILFLETISSFLMNKVMIRKFCDFEFFEKYKEKIFFVAKTLQKMEYETSEMYIIHLKNTIDDTFGVFDEFFDRINKTKVEELEKEILKKENLGKMSERDGISSTEEARNRGELTLAQKEIEALLKTSSLSIIRSLNKSVAHKYVEAFKMTNSTVDDYLVYDQFVLSVESFSRTYSAYLQASLSEMETKTKIHRKFEERVKNATNIVLEKKQTNDTLLEKLNKLRKEKRLPLLSREQLIESSELMINNNCEETKEEKTKRTSFKQTVFKIFGGEKKKTESQFYSASPSPCSSPRPLVSPRMSPYSKKKCEELKREDPFIFIQRSGSTEPKVGKTREKTAFKGEKKK